MSQNPIDSITIIVAKSAEQLNKVSSLLSNNNCAYELHADRDNHNSFYFIIKNASRPVIKEAEMIVNNVIDVPIEKYSNLVQKIISSVASYYDCPIDDLVSAVRKEELVVPRQMIMYLLKKYAEMSFSEIARVLSRNEHTIAIHGIKSIEEKLNKDVDVSKDLSSIEMMIFPEKKLLAPGAKIWELEDGILLGNMWEEIKQIIWKEYDLSEITYKTWVRPLELYSITEETVTILVPSDQEHARTYMTYKFGPYFEVVFKEKYNHQFHCEFVCLKDISDSTKEY